MFRSVARSQLELVAGLPFGPTGLIRQPVTNRLGGKDHKEAPCNESTRRLGL
jgi:hypothetical protein